MTPILSASHAAGLINNRIPTQAQKGLGCSAATHSPWCQHAKPYAFGTSEHIYDERRGEGGAVGGPYSHYPPLEGDPSR